MHIGRKGIGLNQKSVTVVRMNITALIESPVEIDKTRIDKTAKVADTTTISRPVDAIASSPPTRGRREPYNPLMSTQAIKKASVSSFGPFDGTYEFNFVPRITVIMGDNGTGKSQLLKLLYACTNVFHDVSDASELLKTNAQRRIAAKLNGVCKPDFLGRLVTRRQGRARADIAIQCEGFNTPLQFSFASNSKTEVKVGAAPSQRLDATPVFLPPYELMSLYPGFVSLYNTRETNFDETVRDACDLLGRSPLRPAAQHEAADGILEPLMETLGGDVTEHNGRFYLRRAEGEFEMPLVAEGLRKLAAIYRLVRSGVLLSSGYLFWDEPEANLNPVSQLAVARTLMKLADNGVQIFLGTHSAFLVRQLELECKTPSDPGLHLIALKRDGVSVSMAQGSAISDIPLDYLSSFRAEYFQTDCLLAGEE